MPRANRFPNHYDHALLCRKNGLDDTADFIHQIASERDAFKRALADLVDVLAKCEKLLEGNDDVVSN